MPAVSGRVMPFFGSQPVMSMAKPFVINSLSMTVTHILKFVALSELTWYSTEMMASRL